MPDAPSPAPARPVLWLGPPARWADALPGPVRSVEGPDALRGWSAEDAALVVLSERPDALADWLRRPRSRPPVLVVAGTDADEDAALEAGAEGVVPAGASPREARRAARHAARRHGAARLDAELYRVMVESALDVISVVEPSGRAIYASPSAESQTGYTPEGLMALAPFENVHPEDQGPLMAAFFEGVQTGRPTSARYRAIGPDGTVRVLESSGRTATGPDGQLYGIVTTRNVTARAETERRLATSEARFRTIVGALPDVVSRLRADGFVLDYHVPDAFATEFLAETVIGQQLTEVIPEDLAAKLVDALDAVQRTQQIVTYGYDVEVEGKTRHREVRMAPINEDEVLSILRDVTALREHEAALETSQSELRALAAHLQDIRETERTRLSREVHDVLGQQLTAIRLGIGWFGRHYADDHNATARLEDVRALIDETVRHVRQIAADLRPGVLDDFGLAPAVEWQAERFAQRTETACPVTVEGTCEPPTDVATTAFRVFQEALTNVARHAEASVVRVTLGLAPGAVRLVVEDDGQGFDVEAGPRRSLGLVGMRERAAALGGTVRVVSAPGEGTRVEGTFPYAPPDPA